MEPPHKPAPAPPAPHRPRPRPRSRAPGHPSGRRCRRLSRGRAPTQQLPPNGHGGKNNTHRTRGSSRRSRAGRGGGTGAARARPGRAGPRAGRARARPPPPCPAGGAALAPPGARGGPAGAAEAGPGSGAGLAGPRAGVSPAPSSVPRQGTETPQTSSKHPKLPPSHQPALPRRLLRGASACRGHVPLSRFLPRRVPDVGLISMGSLPRKTAHQSCGLWMRIRTHCSVHGREGTDHWNLEMC
ncbi:translation initiation factor IF-2-like [Chiroxiphia lanceolata]|uniref:translation initiation factor IF-2-like n=1 Tax=Chiroxiphia lanceolata TaxID=296741 RepID=UPI0013CE8DAE|nr:translation initiation factor IF-2-like [Chiroxiphia lanceolata]